MAETDLVSERELMWSIQQCLIRMTLICPELEPPYSQLVAVMSDFEEIRGSSDSVRTVIYGASFGRLLFGLAEYEVRALKLLLVDKGNDIAAQRVCMLMDIADCAIEAELDRLDVLNGCITVRASMHRRSLKERIRARRRRRRWLLHTSAGNAYLHRMDMRRHHLHHIDLKKSRTAKLAADLYVDD